MYFYFKDNICGADWEDIQLLIKYNKGISFSLCITNTFSKYAWVVLVKARKVLQLIMLLKKIR